MLAFHRFGESRRALLFAGACSTALAICLMPTAAFAQTTTETQTADAEEPEAADTAPTPGNPQPADDDGQEIVVTGIRAGVQGAVNIKRREQGIVEAVTAEDIGKLPD